MEYNRQPSTPPTPALQLIFQAEVTDHWYSVQKPDDFILAADLRIFQLVLYHQTCISVGTDI